MADAYREKLELAVVVMMHVINFLSIVDIDACPGNSCACPASISGERERRWELLLKRNARGVNDNRYWPDGMTRIRRRRLLMSTMIMTIAGNQRN